MEVRMVDVAKKDEKREVPFVVGGVYRLDSDDWRILVTNGTMYATFALDTGGIGFPWRDEVAMRESLNRRAMEYIPDAHLAIPTEGVTTNAK